MARNALSTAQGEIKSKAPIEIMWIRQRPVWKQYENRINPIEAVGRLSGKRPPVIGHIGYQPNGGERSVSPWKTSSVSTFRVLCYRPEPVRRVSEGFAAYNPSYAKEACT